MSGLGGRHIAHRLRVVRELDRIAGLRNYPFMIVSDNG